MVDFNSEGTMSKPPKEVMALIIVEDHYNLKQSLETYSQTYMNGATIGLASARARLLSLYIDVCVMLERRLGAEVFKRVTCDCLNIEKKMTFKELWESYLLIIRTLDDMGLLKLDTKPQYNRHRVEEANKQHGY